MPRFPTYLLWLAMAISLWRLLRGSKGDPGPPALRVRPALKANRERLAPPGGGQDGKDGNSGPAGPGSPLYVKTIGSEACNSIGCTAECGADETIASATCLSNQGPTTLPTIRAGAGSGQVWTASCPGPSGGMVLICTRK